MIESWLVDPHFTLADVEQRLLSDLSEEEMPVA